MPTTQTPHDWRSELHETLTVCVERANRPVALPHCAICARYATDNLPFEALMSLFEVMPKQLRKESLHIAQERLTAVRPSMRQQQVDSVILPVLMDSPGWPLVRSLVIDMADQAIFRHLNDPRLGAIEEITLLGFAYGGCYPTPEFCQALFNSPSLVKVRTLHFHSIESGEELSRLFWGAPMARRLERVTGVPYFGETIANKLALRELALARYGKIPDGLSLKPLLGQRVSPRLRELSLGAYFEAVPPFLAVVAREVRSFDRVESVSFFFSDFSGEQTPLLRSARLPASTKTVSWYCDYHHVSLIRPRRFEHRRLYDFTSEKVDIRFGDKLTDYGDLIFDWGLRDEISRRVENLSLLLPLKTDLGEVVAFLDELPGLKQLTLVYPFTEPELDRLLEFDRVRRLDSLTLALVIEDAQWEAKNKYMKANRSRYRSKIPAKWLFEFAFGERTATIQHLSIAAPDFDLTRTPDRIQHCEIYQSKAGQEFAKRNPPQPIESLSFRYDLNVGKPLAAALTSGDWLGKVDRLAFQGEMDEPAARLIADCVHLRNLRDFSYHGSRNPLEASRLILHSPNLRGVWHLSLSLPQLWDAPESADLCAGSPLLDHAAALDIAGPDQSPLIPQSGRLGRVRRLGECTSSRVFGDARLASVWKDHPLGSPLKAKAAHVVKRVFRVEHALADLPDLEAKLLELAAFSEEDVFQATLRSLLATAFRGQPAPEGARFEYLDEHQQRALRTVAALDESWWTIGGLVRDVTLSYGFDFWEREKLVAYIEGGEALSQNLERP